MSRERRFPPIEVNRNTTFEWTGVLRDHSDTPIPASDLDSLTLTLFLDGDTGAVINGRSNQDVLNTNQVTLSEEGVISWISLAADSPVINSALGVEIHIAKFSARWGSGKGIEHQLVIFVKNTDRRS